MARICVLGGTGFIGGHLLNRLVARGEKIVLPTRRLKHARDLFLLPTVEVIEADIHDDAVLARLLRGCDAAINLVGVLHSRPGSSGKEPYGPDFARAHVALPERLAYAALGAGIRHLVHVSALGAEPDAPSEYLRSKAAGEAAILAVRDRLPATVFRPSVVFGPEDRFLNLFAGLARWLPVLLVPCPDARFQPVYVGDVAQCLARCLFDPAAYHRNYDLCGPSVYTLQELVKFAVRASGHRKLVLGLSERMSYLQGAIMEWLPGKPMTRDNVRSMKVANVCHCDFPFGLRPLALEGAAPAWLAGRDSRGRRHGPSGRLHH
jgi:NADH dehydrogenase